MDFFHSIAAVKLIFVLGIVNLVFGILIFASCRCIPMSPVIGKRLMKYSVYQHFYKLHCYLWPIFLMSVIVHSFVALKFLGNPF